MAYGTLSGTPETIFAKIASNEFIYGDQPGTGQPGYALAFSAMALDEDGAPVIDVINQQDNFVVNSYLEYITIDGGVNRTTFRSAAEAKIRDYYNAPSTTIVWI